MHLTALVRITWWGPTYVNGSLSGPLMEGLLSLDSLFVCSWMVVLDDG